MTSRPDRGSALVTVLFVLLLAGGFLAVTFPVALEHARAARKTIKVFQAAAAAESGVEEVVASWPVRRLSELAVHDSAFVGSTALASQTGWYRGVVERLGFDHYAVRIEGFTRDTVARRLVGAIIRRLPLNLGLSAPLSGEVDVTVTPPGLIAVSDSVPPGSEACRQYPTPSNHAVTDATGRARFDSVTARISGTARRIGPGAAELRGELSFSIMEAPGDLVLTGGEALGVLLVHGALVLEGGVRFRGLILVDGPLLIRGGEVIGAVVVTARGGTAIVEQGSIVYSTCLLGMVYAELGEVGHIKSRWLFRLQ